MEKIKSLAEIPRDHPAQRYSRAACLFAVLTLASSVTQTLQLCPVLASANSSNLGLCVMWLFGTIAAFLLGSIFKSYRMKKLRECRLIFEPNNSPFWTFALIVASTFFLMNIESLELHYAVCALSIIISSTMIIRCIQKIEQFSSEQSSLME